MTKRNIDILCISETWLLPQIPDNYIHIPGYKVYRCDKSYGGGACVYVKVSLTTKIFTSDDDRPDGVEDVWLSIQCRKIPFVIVGIVYRHPNASQQFFEYLNNTLRNICIRNKCMYMLGDLYDDLFTNRNKLSSIIRMNKLHQVIDKPTRVTPQTATLRDVIVTNRSDTIIHKDVMPSVIADHDLITATINISKPKRAVTTKTFRHMGAYSKDAFCNAISSYSSELSNIYLTDDIDTQVNILCRQYLLAVLMNAPLLPVLR